jgi:alkylhydroperoxidase family enzyme
MARLPDMTADDEIAARIRARRGGELRPLDAMLLHSPPVADGWNQLMAAIRAADPGAPLSDLQQLVIAATDAMTRGVRLPAPLFESLRGHLSDRQVFELVTTVAACNMVSRLVVALDISSPAARA